LLTHCQREGHPLIYFSVRLGKLPTDPETLTVRRALQGFLFDASKLYPVPFHAFESVQEDHDQAPLKYYFHFLVEYAKCLIQTDVKTYADKGLHKAQNEPG
jgi:hypothetical protein